MIYRSGHYSETNSETSRKLPCRFVLSHGHVKLYERWLGKTDCFGHNNRYRKINMAVRLHWGNYTALGQLYYTRAVILHWGSYTAPRQLYCTGAVILYRGSYTAPGAVILLWGSYSALRQLFCTGAVILHWGSYTTLSIFWCFVFWKIAKISCRDISASLSHVHRTVIVIIFMFF